MLTCPWCKKIVDQPERECPYCRADLSLLAGFVDRLNSSLARAELMTRQGQLGEAVWAYLEVLDVDPENIEARHQVGKVAAAVRNFDSGLAAARRQPGEGWTTATWLVIVLAALALGIVAGMQIERWARPSTVTSDTEEEDAG